MHSRSLWSLAFVLGLVGGAALATGWYTATGSELVELRSTPGVVGGVRAAPVDPAHVPPRPGRWVVSTSGALTWVTEDAAAAGAKGPDAEWLRERERSFADITRDIECQISGCDPTR